MYLILGFLGFCLPLTQAKQYTARYYQIYVVAYLLGPVFSGKTKKKAKTIVEAIVLPCFCFVLFCFVLFCFVQFQVLLSILLHIDLYLL